MIENEVEVSPIVLVQEDIVDSAPVQESDVEKAKQDLTVNVLRVMMVPPGVAKIFIYRSRGYHLVNAGYLIKLDTW